MDTLVSVEGAVNMSLGWIPLNFHNQAYTQYAIVTYVRITSTDINVTQRSWFTTNGGYAILEYTKNTS